MPAIEKFIGLDVDFIDELKTRVAFDSDADIARFAEDAMRVYADLGQLLQGDGTLMWHPAEGEAKAVRLPFSPPKTSTRRKD